MNVQGIYYGLPNLTHRQVFALAVVLALLVSVGAVTPALVQNVAPALGPLRSEKDAPALLQFTSGGHALGFTAQGMYAATGTHALHMDFLGANSVAPQADSPASMNGQTAPLSRVTYTDLWDGISLTYSTSQGSIYTTTYALAPGADASDIRLRYNAPLVLNKDGTLSIAFDTGNMTESAPVAWQEVHGQRVFVDISFRVRGQEVTFTLGQYNPRYALTIDPSVVWNTFLGGSGNDQGRRIAVDASGNVYVTGVSSASWGTPVRAYDSLTDGFAAKLTSAGVLTWNTFLGGSGSEEVRGIAVDGSGNVYVAGYGDATWGTSPVRAYTSSYDGFAVKLSSAGALTWHTFLGGSGFDGCESIAVDGDGNVYVVGWNNAAWGSSPVRAYSSGYDGFAAKLTSAGVKTWHTFLGGSGDDDGNDIAVDGTGNVYVAGDGNVTWGSPVRAHDLGANYDGFAAKLDSTGVLSWNTFLGGSGSDYSWGIAVDGSGNVHVVGYGDATWGSPLRAHDVGANHDAFAAKLDALGALTWNTFLGGSGDDATRDMAMDASGNVYVTGDSDATWGSPVRAYTSLTDAFAAKLSSAGALTWNTFLGGSGYDAGWGVAVDGSSNVYVAGYSTGTWGAPVRAYTASFVDAFVAKWGVVTFKSVGTYDGWILESAETSGVGGSLDFVASTLKAGDDAADKQYRSIVSFNTASLPDNAVITKVTLKIRRQGITGTNPFTTHGGLIAAIRKPYFGASIDLVIGDFQAAQSAQVGFNSTPVGTWYSTNNNPVTWPYINLTGTTQFRLRFTLDDNDNATADYVSFYSGNAGAAYRPQLIVEYYVP